MSYKQNIFYQSWKVIVIGVVILLAVSVLISRVSLGERIGWPQVSADASEITIEMMPDAAILPEKTHYAANLSYKVKGTRYYPTRQVKPFEQEGGASWYGKQFHGKLTTSGEPYNMHEMTAAHRTLPIPSYVRVTNLANGKEVIVRINDRGPFHSNRIIDLSYAAADKLGYTQKGVTRVRIEQVVPEESAEQSFVTMDEFDSLKEAQLYMEHLSHHLPDENLQVKMEQTNGRYQVFVGPMQKEIKPDDFKQNVLETL